MNEPSIQEQYRHIIGLLDRKRLKEALTQLEAYLWDCKEWSLRTRLEQAQTSYNYMLQYMRQGVDDPGRQKLYRQLLRTAYEVADQARITLLDGVSSHYYHSLHRNNPRNLKGYGLADCLRILEAYPDELAVCQLMPDNRESLDAILKRHEETGKYLFLGVWGNSQWSAEEARVAADYLASELLPAADLCLMASAMLLSLMECFDARKFAWLLDASLHTDTAVAQRALTAIAIVIHLHPDRPALYPELEARLHLMDEGGELGRRLNRIYLQLLASKETEKVERRMREEIIPEMIRNAPFIRNLKFDLDATAIDENDSNPDWLHSGGNANLDNTIREMNELQEEGADIYMGSFAQLKMYPFFGEPHNWFYPFDKQHSSVAHLFGPKQAEENSFLDLILHSSFFCNSDKYSLCFTMARIPQSQRDMMLDQVVQPDLDKLKDKSYSDMFDRYVQRAEVISRLYIYDLYRFFKLSQRRDEFRDIFQERLGLHRIPLLRPILRKAELMKEVADFYFRKDYPEEALKVYRELAAMPAAADADIYQKIGYCLQKEKNNSEAIEAYRKADVLKPDHLWTLRHLATCHRLSGNFASALGYYRRVEAVQPDDRYTLFAIGSCLAALERYDEALHCFFKLDFLEGDCIKAWRAIGWCSFVSGKYEQAMKYYDRVLALGPVATDYLNAGHVAWSMGNLTKAIECYGHAAAESGSREAFLEMFDKDRETLLAQGIAEEDMPLVLDMV